MTVIWEHVSRTRYDRCQMHSWCMRRPRWVVQTGRSHRLACIRHCPKLTP